MGRPEEVTLMLRAAQEGDANALNDLVSLLYEELREIAAAQMKAERRDHTLQPTALVHEAYVRLVRQQDETWRSRSHFFASAASAIRRILIEHARGRGREKRGGGRQKLPLDAALDVSHVSGEQMIAVDEALEELGRLDPQKAKIVELRFFGGLTAEEAAEVLNVSESTVAREWRLARAFLRATLGEGAPAAGSAE